MAAIVDRRYTTYLTTDSVLPLTYYWPTLRYTYIDQNLQLHVINTFQFTNNSRTTKLHNCKHEVTRGSALKSSQSVSGTLDQPRVVAPSKTCGHVRSSRRRWRWRSAAPTFGRVILAGASTPACCPVYRLCERPQPGVVRCGLVSLPVVAARDQKWRATSDRSGLLSLLRQFG